MINKEPFVKIMNSIRDYYDELHIEMDRLNVVFEDNYLVKIVDDVLDALIDDIKPEIGGEPCICYFAWGLDFGRDDMAVDCVKINGQRHSLTTAEELYDLITMLKDR